MKNAFLFLGGCLVVISAFLIFISNRVSALDEYNCLTCHSNPDLTITNEEGTEVSLYVNEDELNTSAHRYIDCTTCHSTNPHEVSTPLNKLSLAEKCGTCHQYEYKLHLSSVHGKQLLEGNMDVATCVDCHSNDSNPHSVIRVLEYDAAAYKKNIAQTCGKCHNNTQLMASYGIVEKVYESYMLSYHGKAIQLGNNEISKLNEATCTNCHGTHDIQSVTNPESSVSGLENLAKTCEQCHPGAGVKFASSFLGHKEAAPNYIPTVYYTEKFFNILLIAVVTFGALVVSTAIVRFSINRWRE